MSRTKKAFHHGDLRRALLEASLHVLETEGVAALSLRKVAAEAGVTHGAPYHHFREKTDLIVAIAADGFEKLGAAMQAAYDGAGEDPIHRLSAVGRAYVTFAQRHRGHYAVMFRPDLTVPDLHAEVDAKAKAPLELLRRVLEECQAAGYAALVEPRTLVLMCWSSVHGLAELWLNGPLQKLSDLVDANGDGLALAVDELANAIRRTRREPVEAAKPPRTRTVPPECVPARAKKQGRSRAKPVA